MLENQIITATIMEPAKTASKRVAVLGGGITGLVAARELMQAGYEVDVYEAAARTGGKIASKEMGKASIDSGAEFVDSNHKGILALCKTYGIKLKDATDQNHEEYAIPGGRKVSGDAFAKAAAGIQQRIIRDKQQIEKNPEGELARRLDGMSLADYLGAIQKEEEASQASSLTSRLGKMMNNIISTVMPARKDISTADAATTIKGLYTAEAGRDAKNISALQFVNEMSSTPGQFLASDCAYRIEGGTQTLTDALRKDLEAKGTKFHTGAQATGISKKDGKFQIDFKDGVQAQADQVMLAMPTKGLSEIKGLTELGLTKESQDTLTNAQYTHSTKFSIAMKGDGKDACMYSSEGFQAWRSAPGVMTFLVGGETMNEKRGGELVKQCLASYAKAQGKKMEDVFEVSQISYSGAGTSAPCYLSPAPGQSLKMASLSRNIDDMAANGIGIAGTFVPQRESGSASIGFMECGVESATRATQRLAGKEQSQDVEQGRANTRWRDTVKQAPVLNPNPAFAR